MATPPRLRPVADDLLDAEVEVLEGICANPRCDERLDQRTGRGRRPKYHNEDCRRAAESDQRRLEGRLRHFEGQVRLLRAQLGAYVLTDTDGSVASLTTEVSAGLSAVDRAEGIADVLQDSPDRYAQELVRLARAVAPVVRAATQR